MSKIEMDQMKKDLVEDHHSLSCHVLNQLRSFIISADFTIDDDQLLTIESFFSHHVNRMLTSCFDTWSEWSNWRYVKSMLDELYRHLSSSLYLLNKTKHLILIPCLHSYYHLISIKTVMQKINDDQLMNSCVNSMKQLLILLLSFSSLPHEIQVFFNEAVEHSNSNLDQSFSPLPSPDDPTDHEMREDFYFSILPRSVSHGLTSNLPTHLFAFTPFSSLSLPPVKSFPLKSFTFSSYIRLETVQNQQHMNQQLHQNHKRSPNDQRMFLFSFKTSSSPPLGYTACFTFPSSSMQSTNDQSAESTTGGGESNTVAYLRLTVSCFKGSLSPSLSHTLAFPFPLSSPASFASNQFIHLTITFSSTSLCLYINGELIESNSNDWSIGNVKTPAPFFDRCFIGCPFSPQSKANITNPNENHGFTGQLTSIYIFSTALSSSSVSFLHLIDPSNAYPSFPPTPGGGSSSSTPSSSSSAVTISNSHHHHHHHMMASHVNSAERITSKMTTGIKKEREKCLKELNTSLVCLYSPSNINWPIVLQMVPSCNTSLTSHALIQGQMEVIQRSLIPDSIQSLNQGMDVMLSLLISFTKVQKINEFSQLFSFCCQLIGFSSNSYFLESSVNCNFFPQILSTLSSLAPHELESFLLLPSRILPSILSLIQSLLSSEHQNSSYSNSYAGGENNSNSGEGNSAAGIGSSSSSANVRISSDRNIKNNSDSADGNSLGKTDAHHLIMMSYDKLMRLKNEILKQLLDLFVFNSFLWNLLITPSPLDAMRTGENSDSSDHQTKKIKRREETLSTVYSFISTSLLNSQDGKDMTRDNLLLQRNKRITFMIQIFSSLKNHFYHLKYHLLESDAHGAHSSSSSTVASTKERRERVVALIRSHCLMFIKSLLAKSSDTSRYSPVNMDMDAESSADVKRHQELMEGLEEEESMLFEETNAILNYLSVTSREILMKDNFHQKSLLNIIDVLGLLNTMLVEIPSTMIPSFDSRKGIQVLFQLINNTIGVSSPHHIILHPNHQVSTIDNVQQGIGMNDEGEDEEKEVIRSLCLKILGSFLMRSTAKRKAASMTSAHFSILYYMLSRDPSIISHSLYVNLMEITIESPISSIHSNCNSRSAKMMRIRCSEVMTSASNDDLPAVDDEGDFFYANVNEGVHHHQQSSSSPTCDAETRNGSLKEPAVKIENPQVSSIFCCFMFQHTS